MKNEAKQKLQIRKRRIFAGGDRKGKVERVPEKNGNQ